MSDRNYPTTRGRGGGGSFRSTYRGPRRPFVPRRAGDFRRPFRGRFSSRSRPPMSDNYRRDNHRDHHHRDDDHRRRRSRSRSSERRHSSRHRDRGRRSGSRRSSSPSDDDDRYSRKSPSSPTTSASGSRRNAGGGGSLSPGSTASTGNKETSNQDRRSRSTSPSKESLRITVDNDHFEARRHLWKPIGAGPPTPELGDSRSSPTSGFDNFGDLQGPPAEYVDPDIDAERVARLESVQDDVDYADAEMGRRQMGGRGRPSYRDDGRDRWSGGNGGGDRRDRRDSREKHVSSIVPLGAVARSADVDDDVVWKIPKVLNERDMDAFDDDVNCSRFAKRIDNPNIVKPKIEPKVEPKEVTYDMFGERMTSSSQQAPHQPRSVQAAGSVPTPSFFEQGQTPISSSSTGQLPGLGFDDAQGSFLRSGGRPPSPESRATSEFTIPGLGGDMDIEDEDKFLYGDEDSEPEYNSRQKIPGLGSFSSPIARPKVPPTDPRTARDLGNILQSLGVDAKDSSQRLGAQMSIPAVVSTITELYQRIHDHGGSSRSSAAAQDPRVQSKKESAVMDPRQQSRQDPMSAAVAADPRQPSSSSSSVRKDFNDPRRRRNSGTEHHQQISSADPRTASSIYESVDPRTIRRDLLESRSSSSYDALVNSNRRQNSSAEDAEYRITPAMEYNSRDPRIAAQQQQHPVPPSLLPTPTNLPPTPVVDVSPSASSYPAYDANVYQPPSAVPAPSAVEHHQNYPYAIAAPAPNYYGIPPPSEVPRTSPSTMPAYPPPLMYQSYSGSSMSTTNSASSTASWSTSAKSDYPSQSRPSNLRVIVPTSTPEVTTAQVGVPKPRTVGPLVDNESVRAPANLEERQQLKFEYSQTQKKVQLLGVELERLRRHQGELMRKKQKQKDGHNDPQLVKNSRLQEAHDRQISLAKRKLESIERALKGSEGLRNAGAPPSRSSSLESPPPPARRNSSADERVAAASGKVKSGGSIEERGGAQKQQPSTPPPKQFRFVDSTDNWCKHCGEIFKVATDMLKHLHVKHAEIMEGVAPADRPWAAKPKEPNSSVAGGQVSVIFFQGIEFMLPCSAFYCDLCKEFSGDVIAARIHLESEKHNAVYQRYVKNNPSYPKRMTMERNASLLKRREESKRRADVELRDTLQAKKRRIEAELAAKEKRIGHDDSDMDISDGEDGSLADPQMPPGGSRPIRLNLLSHDEAARSQSKIAIKLGKGKESSKSAASTSVSNSASAATEQRTQRILSNLYKNKKIKKEKVGDGKTVQQIESAPLAAPPIVETVEKSTPVDLPRETLPEPPLPPTQPLPPPVTVVPISVPISPVKPVQSNFAPRPNLYMSFEEVDLMPPGVDFMVGDDSSLGVTQAKRPPPPPSRQPAPRADDKSRPGEKDKATAKDVADDKGRNTEMMQVRIKTERKTPERDSHDQTSSTEMRPQMPDDFNFDEQDLHQVLDAIPLPDGLDDVLGADFMMDSDKSASEKETEASKTPNTTVASEKVTADDDLGSKKPENVAESSCAIGQESADGGKDKDETIDEESREQCIFEILEVCKMAAEVNALLESEVDDKLLESEDEPLVSELEPSKSTDAWAVREAFKGESSTPTELQLTKLPDESVDSTIVEGTDAIDTNLASSVAAEKEETLQAESETLDVSVSHCDVTSGGDRISNDEFNQQGGGMEADHGLKAAEPENKPEEEDEVDVKPDVRSLDAHVGRTPVRRARSVARRSRGRGRARARGRGRGRVTRAVRIKTEPTSECDDMPDAST